MPLVPYSVIAGSFAIDLAGLGVLLALLPDRNRDLQPQTFLSAWFVSVIVCACAFAGLGMPRTHAESFRTLAVLWGLFAAQAATIAACHGVLSLLLRRNQTLSRQLTMFLIGAAATALFWTRVPIQIVAQSAPGTDAAEIMAEGMLKLSPPAAVASVWYQESDAARAQGGRFDLIHGAMTYELWIGSRLSVAYPDILPTTKSQEPERKAFVPGLILAMLLWGLPLILLADTLFLWPRSVPSLSPFPLDTQSELLA